MKHYRSSFVFIFVAVAAFIVVFFTAVFAGTVTFILFRVVDAFIGLRVDIEDESIGLDLTQLGERAYSE